MLMKPAEDNTDNGIAKAFDENIRSIRATLLSNTKPETDPVDASTVPVETTSEALRKFVQSGERLFQQQQKRLSELESAYLVGRVQLVDTYRSKLRDLQQQAEEAVRIYDRDNQAAINDARTMLAALTRMRGGEPEQALRP